MATEISKVEEALIPDPVLQKRALDYVTKLKKRYASQRSELAEVWRECWNAYLCRRSVYFYEGRSKVYVPALKMAVDLLVPRITNPLYEIRKFFTAVAVRKYGASPEEREYFESKENLVRDYLMTQLLSRDFFSKFDAMQRQKAILGSSVMKVLYVDERKKRKKRIVLEDGRVETVSVDCGYRGVDFQVIPLEDFYTDAREEDIGKSLGNIHSVLVSWEQLKAMEKRIEYVDGIPVEKGVYFNLDEIAKETKAKASDYSENLKREKFQALGINFESDGKNEYLYDEFWGQFDIDNDGELEECVIGVLNERIVIRLEENPFLQPERPFIFGIWEPILGCAYGTGVINRGTLTQQYELNDVRCQAMDWRTMCLIPIVSYLYGAVNPADIKFKSGSKIPVSALNALQFVFPPPQLASSADISEEKLKIDIQDATGAIRLLQGMPTGTPLEKTATGMIRGIQEANQRIKAIINRTETKELLPLLQKVYNLNEQFSTGEFLVETLEGGRMRVDFERLIDEYDFRIEGISSLIEAQEKVSKLKDILALTGGRLPVKVALKIIGKIWQLYGFDGWEDIEAEIVGEMEMAGNYGREI